MGLLQNLGFASGTNPSSYEMPEIFEFLVEKKDFVSTDLKSIYSTILTDTIERCEGLPDEVMPLLSDNAHAANIQDGLITLVSKAMVNKSDLYLVYRKATKVLTKADPQEQTKIIDDYKQSGASDIGIYLTFKNFDTTDMLKIYSSLEYYTISSLYKNMNLSKALQVKLKDLRSSVASLDSSDVVEQAKAIAKNLASGKDVLLDAGDQIITQNPDLTATQASMDFIAQKQSFYLGLPSAYITGLSNKGLGDSGNADEKAIDRGLKKYFFSIVKPMLEPLFGINVNFKEQSSTTMQSALQMLKDFDLVSEEFISKENKIKLINQAFDLPDDATGDEIVPAPNPLLEAE